MLINPRLVNKQDYLGKTLLMHAIINENFSYVTRLMSIGGIDYSLKTFETQQSALMFATERGFSSIMFKILSDYSVNDCDVEGKTILMYSVDYFSLVLAILKKDSLNINAKDKKGRNVLMYAMERLSKQKNPFDQKSGLRQSINALIDTHSIDLKAKDNRGRTILDYAKETKDKEIIQKIIGGQNL
ncbi:ankyrin repeat domain-containing protein [Naegleria gruberi]|uniref:Ankyrin repeat domain-containing protein n=1 Tax=Naegleria gruberi TaxID=5762 RepID=D2V8P9_NAEGR|nr:ankyrin repeat domain-containing protein [Naegleria gruberi]EFC46838.1 ankyrin repeat domain-containing protein [Naegleria gruberi]|eukprot:XP_002679582.1 ankyrin repeat domain-containing protein [Naegleria gruberi strain NEG-M]